MEDSKPIWASKTIWSLVITVIGIAFPKIKSALGDAATQDAAISTVVTLIGLVSAAIFRYRASSTLTVKK